MKANTKELNTFIQTRTWRNEMNGNKGLDGWDNYSGGAIEEADWVWVCSRSRDSETIAESNFECALEQLGGESKNVHVVRFGHWGCGWFEVIFVNPKAKLLARKAFQIVKAIDNYPVLDEDDYFERETKAYEEYADGAKVELAKALSKHFGLKNTRALVKLAYSLNIEVQRYAGSDACISVYSGRKPGERDLKLLKEVMNQLSWEYSKSRVYRALREALGLETK